MNLYLDLFLTFFKIGLFTFGGGYAMLPMVEQEVNAHGWMTMNELVNFVAVSESTPGPFAVNTATYVGTETGGFPGAMCATLGVVMPSFIIILLIAKAYQKFENSPVVKGVMSGLRPAVVGLIGAAVISVGITVFIGSAGSPVTSTGEFWVSLLICSASIYFIIHKKTHPILIIVVSAVVGIACGMLEMF